MGNKTERIPPTAAAVAAELPLLFFHAYFFEWQTYVCVYAGLLCLLQGGETN